MDLLPRIASATFRAPAGMPSAPALGQADVLIEVKRDRGGGNFRSYEGHEAAAARAIVDWIVAGRCFFCIMRPSA